MRDAINDTAVLQAVLGRSLDMIVFSQVSGRILYVNPSGVTLSGLTDLSVDAGRTASIGELFTRPPFPVLARRGPAGVGSTSQWHVSTELVHYVTKQPIPVEVTTFVVDGPDHENDVVVSIVRSCQHDCEREQSEAVAASKYLAAEQQAVAALSRLALDGDLGQLLDTATIAASTLMGVQQSMITRRLDGYDDRLEAVAFTGPMPPRLPFSMPPGRESLMGYTLISKGVVVCENRDEETRFSTVAMAAKGFRSGACVPVPGGSRPWGTLSVHSAENRTYTDRDISFLQTVTDVLSAAIRRLELDQQLHERSTHDPLTGLPNRTVAYERIEQALGRTEHDGESMAVLVLDIDHFKVVNDSLGHEAGDRALVRFAHRLASAVRPGDTVARVGGDEFLVVAEHVRGIGHARQLARALTDAVNDPHPAKSDPIPLGASIGVAVSTAYSTRQELIHQADLAMYRAKDAGVSGYAVFDHDDLYDADRTRHLSVDLRAALGNGALHLAYQPIIDLATGKLVAMEALARWEHPDLGAIDPTEFVAIAERTGVVGDLGEWALQTACAQAVRWRSFSDVGIRVNISALQLRNAGFAAKVAAILAATGLDAAALGLEITETVWVSDTAQVADTLNTLHDLGIELSLDDLGSGYSSIAYLMRYPIFDCFKIDKSYVDDLPAARPTAIITAIVMLARAFDLTVVGEGIETVEQLDTLRAGGCDLGQGFLLGKPMTADQATAELRRRSRR